MHHGMIILCMYIMTSIYAPYTFLVICCDSARSGQFYHQSHRIPSLLLKYSYNCPNALEAAAGDHYNDVIMSVMASKTTGVSMVYPTVCFLRRSMTTSKLRVTGICEGISQMTGEFPAQRVSNVEKVSIWWRYHRCSITTCMLENKNKQKR